MLQEENLTRYTQKQIDTLNNQRNSKYCLVIIFDVIYNLYQFSFDHPGGQNVIMRRAGEILDDIVQDTMHGFTESQVKGKLHKYKFGIFENESISSDSSNMPSPSNDSGSEMETQLIAG